MKANGVTLASIEDPVGWVQQTVYLGPGSQVVQWVHALTFSGSGATAYLDEVSYAPGETAPLITQQPISQSQVPGLNATFEVKAEGTPSLIYQWQLDGTNIVGATNALLTITNTQPSQLGDYRVTVTNATDVITSQAARLEFGEVTGWGVGDFGQGSVAMGATNVLSVGAGYYHGLLLRRDGTLLAWGDNRFGQCDIPDGLTDVIAVAGGEIHSLALQADGTVVGFGSNSAGQTNVPNGLSNVVSVAAGRVHSMALTSDGTVVVWGYDPFLAYGQTNIPPDLTNAVTIASGGFHCLALKADGTVVTWGRSDWGLTNIPPDLTNAVAIAAGDIHSVALRSDGRISVWGSSGFNLKNVPPSLTNAIAISAGIVHNAAITADGVWVGWGQNLSGKTNAPAGLPHAVAISSGGHHNLALVGASAPRASMSNPTIHSEGFSVMVPTQAGRIYRLEYKTSLSDLDWSPLPLVAGNGSVLILTDSTPYNAQRLYRVRMW